MSKRIELELWDVAKLIPYAKNAKKHAKEQVETLAALIQRYGFTQPILIDEHGNIVAGHGRRLACLHLKMDKVPVRVLYGYSAEEIDALRLADNQVSSTQYDTGLIKEEITRLHDLGFEIETLGFSDQELEFLKIDGLETFDESAFVDDITGAVEDQQRENEQKQTDTDAAAAPIADAFGFKRVTVAHSRKIRSFMSRLEAEHGKKGAEALLAHISEIEDLAA